MSSHSRKLKKNAARKASGEPALPVMYGIACDGELLGFSVSSNDGDFCNDVSVSLDTRFDDMPWLTNRRSTAERVIEEEIPWYNTGLTSPSAQGFDRKKLTVVEVCFTYK